MLLTPPTMNRTNTPNRRAQTLNALPGDAHAVVRITAPGMYILNDDLHGQPGKAGIRIECDGVRVDLNGHRVIGCPDSLDGITAAKPVADVTVRNGEVRGWGQEGVDLGRALGCAVRQLRIVGNRGLGLVLGSGATLDQCVVDGNAGVNVAVTSNAT